MKKSVLTVWFLTVSLLLASCGRVNGGQGADTVIDASSGNDFRSESGIDMSEAGAPSEAGSDMPEAGNSAAEKEAADEKSLKEMAAGQSEETVTEEPVYLSDKILKAGDTMELLRFDDENKLEKGLEITLQGAEMSGSPEEAKLDRSLMEKETEDYDLAGNPYFCGIDEAGILTCNLAVKNINEEEKDSLHISAIMIAYVDPDTGKVSILSCMPAYFSASSSRVGASNYYHCDIPKGESKEMTVAWLIPEEYEAENLYLGVTYDIREPEERQYFRLFGQE